MNKDMAIAYLKEINKGKDVNNVVTRLYYGNDGDYVQDLSPFLHDDYMSRGLIDAIQNGQSLTMAQEAELQDFIIEKYV
jgi:hypothetical protein